MSQKYKLLKYACYTTNITMSVVGNLSPILFLTFRSLYGISYSQLGLLVLVNFSTQLAVDLVFSFFSHKFNIPKTVKVTPILGAIGLIVYSTWTFLFSNQVYLGLVIGTIIFSSSSGLAEVLISPVIAAIPSENPDREMSKLHSIYAWGVVGVVVFSTIFLFVFGTENWQWLGLVFMLIPLVSAILFRFSTVPELETTEHVSGALDMLKNKTLWLCVVAIFLGGASECTMSQWCSGYLEQALNIPKVWGDIFGVALFAAMLGLGRSLYAKFGENIERVLFLGVIGATLCYFVAAVSSIPVIGLLACGFTGFCVSMLWPGSLVAASDRISTGGVFIYAMMAAGGDLGASVGPQLVGIITDIAMETNTIIHLANKWGYTPEQLGMKCGMLVGMIFPFIGIFVFLYILKSKKAYKEKDRMKKNYAVITGASSGIGTEFAKRLAKEGYPLVLVARRRDRLEKLAQELNTECIIMSANLSDMDECKRMMQELESIGIEVFINNAGFGYCGETLTIDTGTELNMIDLNVKAMQLLTKLALDTMVERNRGYVLNVASSAGLLPAGPYMSTYYATKAYVASYTRGLAEELRRKNIDVYVGCLCPGPVDTEFNKVANVEFALKGISASYCANYAITQMFKKKITIVPAFKIKALVVLARFIPTKLYIRIAAKQQRKKIYR